MRKLILVEHAVPETVQRGGYTVKMGNFYGYLFEDGRKYPAFWSGWISGYCIALHVMRDGVDNLQWVNEDDIDAWNINSVRDFWGEYFAEEDAGYYPNEWDYIPFFQRYVD